MFTVTITASGEGSDDDKPSYMTGFADTNDTRICCAGTGPTKEKAPFSLQHALGSWISSVPTNVLSGHGLFTEPICPATLSSAAPFNDKAWATPHLHADLYAGRTGPSWSLWGGDREE